MFTMLHTLGLPTTLRRELPAFAVAFVIAELFYKFGSFGLELVAFLATWYVLAGVQSRLTN